MLRAILIKEFRQFRRNTFLPRMVVVFPIVIMALMPLVATMDVKNVNVALVDRDGKDASLQIVQHIEASPYLSLCRVVHSRDEAMAMVEACSADVVVEVPYGYDRSLRTPSPLQLHISANAVNGIKGSLGMQYVVQAVSRVQMPCAVTYCFNPTLNYRHFMIPALMIMLVIMICGFLPALNIVGEKERGTIEQINVTPVSKFVFTLGKLLPYWLIGMLVVSVAMVIAWLLYDLRPAGSLCVVYTASLVFIVFMSSMAVAIANFSDNMQQVMFVMFFFVVVFILMSGLMTPVQSMPRWAQMLTYAIPPRYFIDIMRATYLRGASLADQGLWFAVLTAYALSAAAVAVATYRKRSA